MHHCPRIAPRYLFRWEPAQQAHIMLYPEGLIKLNASAAAILELCDGKHALADIIATLQARHPGSGSEIASAVPTFIATAQAKGWLC